MLLESAGVEAVLENTLQNTHRGPTAGARNIESWAVCVHMFPVSDGAQLALALDFSVSRFHSECDPF